MRRLVFLAAAILLLGGSSAAQNAATPISLAVDLREAPRRIFHAKLTIPARPGPLTLLYPKWIPGEHAPDGPIADLVNLKFTAAGKTLAWRRDDLDAYAFHMQVPAGSDSVEANYDYLSPISGQGYSAGPSANSHIVVLEWNLVTLYPAGQASDALSYQVSVRLPQGWKLASSLTSEKSQGEETDFAPVSLTELVDSPVLAGEFLRTFALAPEVQQPHRLNVAGDSAADVNISAEQINPYSQLVREEGALFGARHYAHYDFLLSLTDAFYPNGLEHHQSSDVRVGEKMFQNADQSVYYNSLLSHEYTHSWNGKYRRPAGLATADFAQPMRGELLWVYEGLTQYIGEMMAVRAGLRTQEDYREALAWTAAFLDYRPGRQWRSLEDTAVSAPVLYNISGSNWGSLRRGVDFYEEGWLIWLEADTIIRRESGGRKSLDDFCRAFYGPPSGAARVVPYTLDDLVKTLNGVQAYDWNGFFRQRVQEINPHAPMGGIDIGGWRLVFNSSPNLNERAREKIDEELDLTFSIGAVVHAGGGADANGRLEDVIPGMPAAQAGLAPGMQIRSVNGNTFSANTLSDALRGAQTNNRAIAIMANNAGVVKTYEVNYHGGARYPHLERNGALPDLLDETLRPIAAGAPNSN